MFAPITWSKVSTQLIDAVTSNYREKILPSLRTQTGFHGGIVLADRTNGGGVAASYWQTAEAMSASEQMATAGRAEAIKTAGGDMEVIEVDRFEIILQDRTAPAPVGTFVFGSLGTSPWWLRSARRRKPLSPLRLEPPELTRP